MNTTNFKSFINVFIFGILSVFLALYLDWSVTQLLFFFYLRTLVRIPFTFKLYKIKFGNDQVGETLSFEVVYLVFFVVFNFFLIWVLQLSSLGFGKFFDPFLNEWSLFMSNYSLGFIGLMLSEYFDFKKKSHVIKPSQAESRMVYLKREVIQLLMLIPVLIILGLIYSNVAVGLLMSLVLFIGLISVNDIYWIKRNALELDPH